VRFFPIGRFPQSAARAPRAATPRPRHQQRDELAPLHADHGGFLPALGPPHAQPATEWPASPMGCP